MTGLNIDKAVKDELARMAADEHRKSLTVSGTVNAERIETKVGAEVGRGWSLAAIYRRLRKSKSDEGGFEVTKEW